MTTTDLVTSVTVHHAPNITFRDQVLREQEAAIAGLLHHNLFVVSDFVGGPYDLDLAMGNDRLTLTIRTETQGDEKQIFLPVRPYRKLIKDYFLICDSYEKAYRTGDATRLEPIDMARRALHNEGASLLQSHTETKGLMTDHNTARYLFTLICILHIGGVRQW